MERNLEPVDLTQHWKEHLCGFDLTDAAYQRDQWRVV